MSEWGMNEFQWKLWLDTCRENVACFRARSDFAGERAWERTLHFAVQQEKAWRGAQHREA